MTMRIYETSDYQAMSRRAADIIAAQVLLKPDCVLGLATGSSPVGAYERLAELCKAGTISFAGVKSVNLDEYKGLAPTHDQSYRYFMEHNLFQHIDIDPANTNVPNGLAEDAGAECARYDALVESLGYADLQLLGLGRNGHIGFNEPGPSFVKPTHVVDLTQSTIDANARFFASAGDVPRQALTMGIGCIMAARRVLMVASGADKADAVAARRVLMVASGADKADAVAKMVKGPITPEVPASILQLHADVVLVADKAALSKL